MHIFIVYCHPSEESFTAKIKNSFIKGLEEAGHTYEISDLYSMKFNSVFSEDEYKREAFYDTDAPIPTDIITEQEKLNRADKLIFIYPVFWTEAPSVLVGWFQRVWTYGFAYGEEQTMKQLKKVLFLVTMGGSIKDDIRRRQIEAMKTVMIGDRINYRADESEMIVFDEMTRGYGNDENRAQREKNFSDKAYNIAKNI